MRIVKKMFELAASDMRVNVLALAFMITYLMRFYYGIGRRVYTSFNGFFTYGGTVLLAAFFILTYLVYGGTLERKGCNVERAKSTALAALGTLYALFTVENIMLLVSYR